MRSPARIAAFGYHEVSDRPHATGFQRPGAWPYKHSMSDFRSHLDALGRSIVPGRVDLLDPRRPGESLLLTFDDGGSSALAAADLLAARGWTGHFFIVTDRIGTRGFLNAAGLRYLRSGGHLVGSHSHTHPDIFAEQSPARISEEWRTSSDILAQHLGEQVTLASVPGGVVSRIVFEQAAEAGLRRLFTSEPRLTPWQQDGCWMFGRFVVKVTTPTATVEALARFRGWRRAGAIRHAKVLARRALPSAYRRLVRNRTRVAAAT